jgi:hypothetical protein
MVEIKFSERKGYIEIVHTGLFSAFKQGDNISKQLEKVIEETECRKILFDGRDMIIDCHLSRIFFTGEHFDRVGFNRRYQIAILYTHYEDKMKFLELVVVNRGYNVRVFMDKEEAVGWLNGETVGEEQSLPGIHVFDPVSLHTTASS